MHYYNFNIADFALHTSHLTLEEEGVYRRLLDYYYDTETPIPKETQPVIRRLRLVSYAEMVEAILAEFFVLESDGWHNLRADIEIALYKTKADQARENGLKGGRPKKNNPAITNPVISANPEETGSQANHELGTSNQEPVTTVKPEPKVPSCQVEKIIESYKAVARKLPDVRVVDEGTKGNIRARWRQDSRFQSIDFWQTFFSYCEDNMFLSGQSEPKDGRTPFRATLAWLVKPANFAKVVNGDYDR